MDKKKSFGQVIYWMCPLVSGYLEDRCGVDGQYLMEEVEWTGGLFM